MENNNTIMNNEEVTNVTTEIAEATSGTAFDTMLKVGLVVGTGFGIYKFVKFIGKRVKARKEKKEAEYEVIEETVDNDSDVEEND